MTTDVINVPRELLERLDSAFRARQDDLYEPMREQIAELLATPPSISDGRSGGLEVWAVSVLDGDKKTTFYTEQLPFVPGRGVKQLGEPVRMVETKHVGQRDAITFAFNKLQEDYNKLHAEWLKLTEEE